MLNSKGDRHFVHLYSSVENVSIVHVQVQSKVDGEQELNVILNAHCASHLYGNLVDICGRRPVNYIEEL